MTARARIEPTTLRLKVIDSTNAASRPTQILQERLRRYLEEVVAEEQVGFRRERVAIDQLFLIPQLAEKYFDKNRVLYKNFVGFKEAFDSVWQQGL